MTACCRIRSTNMNRRNPYVNCTSTGQLALFGDDSAHSFINQALIHKLDDILGNANKPMLKIDAHQKACKSQTFVKDGSARFILQLTATMAFNPGCAMVCPLEIWAPMYLPNFCDVKLKCNEHPKKGRIYVMFHGTNFSAAVRIIQHGFQQSTDGMLGRGVYVTREKHKALAYPKNDRINQVVLRLRVNVGKVKKIDAQHIHLKKTWHDHGYDTAWVPPHSGIVPSGLEEDCIWDPRRIKVVGISHTANPQHMQYLRNLLAQQHH